MAAEEQFANGHAASGRAASGHGPPLDSGEESERERRYRERADAMLARLREGLAELLEPAAEAALARTKAWLEHSPRDAGFRQWAPYETQLELAEADRKLRQHAAGSVRFALELARFVRDGPRARGRFSDGAAFRDLSRTLRTLERRIARH